MLYVWTADEKLINSLTDRLNVRVRKVCLW